MSESRRPSPAPHLIVLTVGLLASTVFLVNLGRHLYFFGDEWDPLLHRGLHLGGKDGILYPHNEHWSTIPIVLYRILWNLIGLNHYGIYQLMSVGSLMATCVGMYVLLRRTGVTAWPAVVAVLILGWGGFGEDTLWAFQVGFLGSLAFGVLAVLAVHSTDRLPPMAAAAGALTVGSLMCSGIGLPMLAWVGCFTLLRRGWLAAIAAAGPPALVYVAWYAAYGSSGNNHGLPDASSGAVLNYTWTGLANIWQSTLAAPGTGGVVFLLLLCVALFARTRPALHALAVSGFVAAFAAFFTIAFSRAQLGPEQAASNRYVPIGLALTLPAFVIALEWLAERLPARGPERVAIPVALTLLLVVTGAVGTLSLYRIREYPDLGDQVLAAVALTNAGEPLLHNAITPPGQSTIDIPTIAGPAIRDHLPDRTPSERVQLDVRAQMQADITSEPGDVPFATSASGHEVTGNLNLKGCAVQATFTPPNSYVEVPGQEGGVQVALVVPTNVVRVQLVRGDVVSAPVSLPIAPNVKSYVQTVAPDTDLRLSFDASTFGLCGKDG